MNEKIFQSFCRVGEAADALYTEGRYREAHDGYARLLHELEDHGLADSYLLAKATLGLLLCCVKLGQHQEALAIWNSDMEESLVGVGIFGLEHAQTSLADMILYDFVCAYLHSLCDAAPEESGKAVNLYMSRVCEHLLEQGEREHYALALSNWKQHLREIFGSSIPYAFASTLIQAEKHLGLSVAPRSIDFPTPSGWERPEGFREMSRLIGYGEAPELRAVSGEAPVYRPRKTQK